MRERILSMGYQAVRRTAIHYFNRRARMEGRCPDLEEAVDFGDRWLKRLDRPFGALMYDFPIPNNLGVWVHDLYFPSPLTLSAFKGDLDVIGFWLRHGLGAATVKTVLTEPNSGNPRPRLQEVWVEGRPTLLNALGLPSEGVAEFVEKFKKSKLFQYGRPIGFSIDGHHLLEYQKTFQHLENFFSTMENPYYYEVNISCPNTPFGQDMTRNPDQLDSLLRFMREHTKAVISVKLSPDQPDPDITRYGEIVSSVGRTIINVGNATFRKCHEVGLPEEAMSVGGGGLSGTPIFARTLEMVSLLSDIHCPIMATGGVTTAGQVLELKGLGVSLIGLATGVVLNPYIIPLINRQLAKTQTT